MQHCRNGSAMRLPEGKLNFKKFIFIVLVHLYIHLIIKRLIYEQGFTIFDLSSNTVWKTRIIKSKILLKSLILILIKKKFAEAVN